MRVNPGTTALGFAKLSISQATSFLDFAKVFATLFKISIPGQDPPKDPNDYKNENSDYGLLVRGKKAREKLNKAAKEILSRVTNPADLNEEERAILKQYSGKGGLSDNSQYEYYTPQHVAEGVWSGLVANGLANGNILDPSTGHGMFSATKPGGIVITGCDLDPTASKVAQLLNAGDSITNKSFEKFCSDTPDNSFDGCCTNVPFGDARGAYKFDDPPYKNEGKIQRYFISRILDKIKPGGLAVLIVPTDIVGAKGSTDWAKWRNSVSRKAEFLGAHKLPSKTFAAQGTDTVVDVVVFRKHPQSLLDIVNDLSFETLMSTNVIFDEFIAGRYWLGEGRPFIMGKWVPKIAGDRFSREAVDGDVDDAGLKAKLASRFVSRIDWAALAVAEPVPRNYVEGDRKVINGIECEMQQGAWTRVASVDDKEALDPQKYGAASIEELKARLDSPKGCLSFTAYQLFAIYKTYPDLLSALASASVEFAMSQPKEELAEQLFRGSIIGGMIARYQDRFNNGSADDSERLALQDLISNEIDRFGHPKNNRGIMLTGESSKMFGLFSNALDEKGNFSDLLNGTLEDSGRHLQYDSTNVQSLVEHLFIREGIQTIELDDVQKLYTGGLPVASLGDLAAFDNVAISPDGIIYPMSRYCSGDIYPKLQALYAAMADETDERIKAKYMQMIGIINGKRKKTKPEDVAFDFNHKWYSKSYVLDFLKENGYPQVTYGSEQEVQKEDPYSGKMRTVKEWVQDPENPFGSFRILGGKKPAGFDLQFENYMNGKPIRGGKDDDDGDLKKQYYDNIKNFRETFNMWMQQQPNIDELAEQYNMKFNAFLPPEYEMTDLGLQGVSKKIVLHGYQNAAIRRFSEEGRGILADDVGLGKTLQTLALVKYNLQMGRSKKTCIVVPKAVFSNWYHEARNYYEGMDDALFVGMRFDRAKDGVILQEPVLDEAGNQKINKYTNEAMWQDKIASGEFDATEVYDDMWQIPQSNVKLVVMTYEKFKSIPLRPDTKQGFIDKWSQRGLLSKQAIKANSEGKDDEVGDEKSLNYNEVKQVERAEGKFADTGAKKGELPYFEDMGFTDVITDEFHSYKNSFEAGEEASRLAYVSTAPASQRGLDMQMKMGHIRATNNDRGSYGLTATPVTNSPVEIFNMLAYVMPLEEFERFGVFTPDDFIRVFGQKDIVDKMTIANETKATEGLVGFQNLDGLRNIFHKYCLLRTAKDVDLDLPPSEEFHEEAILTDEQQGIYDELKEEAKAATKDDSSKFSGDPRPVFSIIRDMEQVSMDPDIFHRRMTFHFAKGDQEKVKQLLKIIPQEVSVRVTPRVGDPEYDLERAEMGEPQKAVSRIYRLLDSLETDLKGDVFIVRLADAFEPFLMDAKKLRDVKLDVGTVGHPLTPKYALMVDRVQKIHELGGKQIIFSDEKAQHQKVARILTHYLPMLRGKIGIINADEAKGSELQRISDRYNSGEYSMVICNQKAEVGVNLQKGTRAIHHLTFPWTPSSIQQRNGRGVRQGNEADNIKIYYYQGKGSFDAYRLHLISKKAGWIGDIFRSDSATAANANAASADEIRFMFEDNPEEAKRKYMEAEAKKAEKAKAQAKARLVNQLQVLASNASVLPRLEQEKEAERTNLAEDISDMNRQIENLRYRGLRTEEGSEERKNISKSIQKKQDALERTQWKLDSLDTRYNNKKAEVQARINKITLELRVRAQKGELPFDEKLIDNPGNCVVTPKGVVLTVGDMYEFKDSYSGTIVIKVIEVNSASRGFKADALMGQLNWNSIPKQSDNEWYDVQDFIADRSPVKVSYSEKEMALQKLLSQEWRYADLLRGDLDRETFTEHYDKIRFYSYDGFVLRGAQGVMFGKPQTGLTVNYPDVDNETWKKEVCEAYLSLKRAGRAYDANSVMRLVFGSGYDAIASEYGRKATEVEILTACATAWKAAMEKQVSLGGVVVGRSVDLAAGEIKTAAQALGDNTSEITRIADQYLNRLKEDIRAKEAQAKAEAERAALEAIRNDPNFKEVPEQVKAAFLALGITVKTNNTNVVIPGYKGRPGKSHAPFTSWFFQDRNGFNGVLRRVSPMMKTRWSAQFFSETGGDFNGAWWYVPISTDLAEVYKLMA